MVLKMVGNKVNLLAQFAEVNEYWSPLVVGTINHFQVKIAKLKGEFFWHTHQAEDEMFYIVKGNLTILFREENIALTEGEFYIVPKGIEHCPIATEEVWIMLIEPETVVSVPTGE
ncbi:MAG: cupin domain-containing protein [Bacteroidetes bacterium]|nr:cupin domain-containing protein [Bacteroidota bacterium]